MNATKEFSPAKNDSPADSNRDMMLDLTQTEAMAKTREALAALKRDLEVLRSSLLSCITPNAGSIIVPHSSIEPQVTLAELDFCTKIVHELHEKVPEQHSESIASAVELETSVLRKKIDALMCGLKASESELLDACSKMQSRTESNVELELEQTRIQLEAAQRELVAMSKTVETCQQAIHANKEELTDKVDRLVRLQNELLTSRLRAEEVASAP